MEAEENARLREDKEGLLRMVTVLKKEVSELTTRVAELTKRGAEMATRLTRLSEERRRDEIGARMKLCVKASEVEKRKRVERSLQEQISTQASKGLAKRHTSARVIDHMFQRQREERERTVIVTRELFAARLIQRHTKARLVRQRTEQFEREAMLRRHSSDMELRLEAQLKRQEAEAAVADKLTEASASLQRLEETRVKFQRLRLIFKH